MHSEHTPPKVRVYTVPNCIDCTAVKFMLDEAGISYEEMDITAIPRAREALHMLSGMMSMPQVFVDGTFVGQVANVRHLIATGQLQKIIASSS